MKLIAFQDGDRRVMARVLDDKALPFAYLEEFWADPQQWLLAAARAHSDGKPIANLAQVPPLPDTARVLCAGLNYVAHAQEAHLKLWQSMVNPFPSRHATTISTGKANWPLLSARSFEMSHRKSPKLASLAMPVSTTSVPANFKWPVSDGRSARTLTAQDRSAHGLLRPTKSQIPIDFESRRVLTATRFKTATRQISSSQAPKSQPTHQVP
jgi:hypothetical protein